MKKLFSNKIFLSLLFFSMGSLSVWGFNQYKVTEFKKHHDLTRPSLFSENLDDYFEEMEQLQSPFFNSFNPFKELKKSQSYFKPWKNDSIKVGISEIQQREDDSFVYYDINIENSKPQKIDVTVKDGQISISGQIESKNENSGTRQYYSSSFHRSFPVPNNVEANSYKMEQEKDKIILKFKKVENS